MPLRVLRLIKVREVTGLSRSMIYQLEAENRFPKRFRLGRRAVGWLESEVQAWIGTRRQCSRQPADSMSRPTTHAR
ncbi:MAG: helix-turn-helix transcriptional regulator [Steroidobacteraceae bacterium]